jgi:hypothetical protein
MDMGLHVDRNRPSIADTSDADRSLLRPVTVDTARDTYLAWRAIGVRRGSRLGRAEHGPGGRDVSIYARS